MMTRRIAIFLGIMIFSLGLVVQVGAQPGTGDTDADGLPDTSDRCPNEAGPRSNDGCPVDTGGGNTVTLPDDIPDDTDGDGTADPLDSCPTRPGDGANGGCPDGVDPNNPGEEPLSPPAELLLAAPTSEDCIASPNGAFGVNMRVDPNPYSDVIHILEVNEWAKVWAVAPEGGNPFTAEHEFGNMIQPLGFAVLPPDTDPDPDPEPEYDPDALWLYVQTEDFVMGWIAEDVSRLGGDCADFDALDNDPDYLDVLMLPNDDGGIAFPATNSFLFVPIIPDPDPMPTFEFDIRLPENDDESLDLSAGCIWVEIGAGGMLLECPDGTTPSFIYCLIQEVGEVGIFQEVCYEVELPEGCTMTSSEAGVWHMECDDDGGINITPFGQDRAILSIEPDDDTVFIVRLLPAVQSAREAAR